MVVAGSEQVAEDEIEEPVGTNSEGVVVVGARISVVVVVTPALRLPMHVKVLDRWCHVKCSGSSVESNCCRVPVRIMR